MYKVVIIEQICPHYRIPLFRELAKQLNLLVIHSQGEPSGNWSNAKVMAGFKSLELNAVIFRLRWNGILCRITFMPKLIGVLNQYHPDVIISEGFTNMLNAILVISYSKLHSIPLIIWDSGRKSNKRMGLLRKILEPINIFILKSASALIAYGSEAKKYFLSFKIDEKKIFIAQNTIDVDACSNKKQALLDNPTEVNDIIKLYSLKDKKVLLYVGGLEKRKKVLDLVEIVHELSFSYTNLCLLIVGNGPEENNIKDFIQRKKIKNCIMLGRVVDGIEPLFLASDVFVLPGQGGLAINQAMAFGKPIIVGVGDGTEKDLVFDNLNGYIVNNKIELKKAIQAILSDNIIKSFGDQSLKIIGKFTIKNMVNEFINAINLSIGLKSEVK